MESGEMDLLSKKAILSLPRDVVKSLDGKILDEYINVKDIEALPTIQPVATDTNVGDTISRQEARLCLTGDITNMTIEQYIKMVGERFDALTPSKPKVKEADWIPCSVRLPEGDEAVLANLTKEYVTWTRVLLTPGSIVQYEYAKGVVDAWRPLPEEYKEGGEKI